MTLKIQQSWPNTLQLYGNGGDGKWAVECCDAMFHHCLSVLVEITGVDYMYCKGWSQSSYTAGFH